MQWAEAGAMTIRSADSASARCGMTILAGGESDGGNRSVKTGWPVRASKVRGPTNRCAVWVITTCSVAPSLIRRRARGAALYAAMLPVTPRTMVLPSVVFTRLRRLGVVHDDAQVFLDLVRIFPRHVHRRQPFELPLPLFAGFLHGLARVFACHELHFALEHFIQRDRRRLGVLGGHQGTGPLHHLSSALGGNNDQPAPRFEGQVLIVRQQRQHNDGHPANSPPSPPP